MIRPRHFFLAGALFLAWAASACGQSVTLPKEVQGDPGAWIVVVPEAKDGGKVKWHVGPGLTRVPIDRLFPGQEPAGVVVQGPKGRYQVWAWNAKGDVASELAVCTVVIGDAPPGPNPPPGPDPPQPPPEPPSPAPIPGDGLRFLIVFETADVPKLTAAQRDALYSPLSAGKVRDYVLAKCPKGPDGKTHDFRIWDKDDNPAGDAKIWQDAMARPRGLEVKAMPDGSWQVISGGTVVKTFARMEDAQKFAQQGALPWVIISNGKSGYEGPLPGTADEFLALLKRFGG